MENVFTQDQSYRQVGEVIHTILAERDQSFAAFAPDQPRSFPILLALVTLLQYAEGYTDRQAAEAARVRADWKYALHLPLSYSGFDPIWLCRLREHAFSSPSTAVGLQALFERLGSTGLFSSHRYAHGLPGSGSEQVNPPLEIIQSICRLNRLVQVTEAMLLAVEALAAQESSRQPALWLSRMYEAYARTFRSLRVARTTERAAHLAGGIGDDIACLLDSIEAWGEVDLKTMPEISHLHMVWETQYRWQEAGERGEPVRIWRPVDCQHCHLDARAKFTPEKIG
jgi:transposase